ncbi:metallophosphoesterase [Allopusillimonas ginsengisoli]|nr:metallophosphoesterase [Allopusillimonas ginsengisoli]TEA80318.1 metallophosphoesterase [Allopusillimonas ginsengisoli]
MRLRILSDLHLGQAGLALPPAQADVVVLAGDISRPQAAVDWALSSFDIPVLYVPGNHEFYGNAIGRTLDALRRLTEGTHVHLLDNNEITLHGVRFLGSTLWSNFDLQGPTERELAIHQAQALIRDFSRIESDVTPGTPFSPADMEALFARNLAWLSQQLEEGPSANDMPTVVITHHAPSKRSIHPRFAGSPINACFVSDCEPLMGSERAALWIHGHTHDSFDYNVKGTRVICNPRGYIRDGVLENARFNPVLTVDVAAPAHRNPAPEAAMRRQRNERPGDRG